tara:strand:+ start:831 stop:1067 length:237 start_codon:yes stop_codon:yes gene_type:complete
MFFRIKLLTLNLGTALILIFFLCLGSQNLNKKHNLNFIISETVSLPIGFLIGTSFTLGFMLGGLSSILMINKEINEEN